MKDLKNLLNVLNTELKGEEVSLLCIDSTVKFYGVDSAYDETSPDDVLDAESVSYWIDDKWINVVFEVVSIDEEEPINSVVKVKCVEEL